jgi:hypothetical protein
LIFFVIFFTVFADTVKLEQWNCSRHIASGGTSFVKLALKSVYLSQQLLAPVGRVPDDREPLAAHPQLFVQHCDISAQGPKVQGSLLGNDTQIVQVGHKFSDIQPDLRPCRRLSLFNQKTEFLNAEKVGKKSKSFLALTFRVDQDDRWSVVLGELISIVVCRYELKGLPHFRPRSGTFQTFQKLSYK